VEPECPQQLGKQGLFSWEIADCLAPFPGATEQETPQHRESFGCGSWARISSYPFSSCTSETSSATRTPSLSFEFFPPRSAGAWEDLYQTIRDLEPLRPSFVSVTYGAGGSTREMTHDLVVRIKQTTSIPPVPHLTCVGHTKDEVRAILERYAAAGVANILALRGDPPRDQPDYDWCGGDFRHARIWCASSASSTNPAPTRTRADSASASRVSRRPSRDTQPRQRTRLPQGQGGRGRGLHLHPVVFRQPRLPRLPRPLPARGHRGADHRRRDAGDLAAGA
jgi:hypothetical protein